MPPNKLKIILQSIVELFISIRGIMNHNYMNEDMIAYGSFDENDLWNPYSKVTCLILYLYSMEIGVPPLYAEINRISRQMELESLKLLGPFVKALGEITMRGEGFKEVEDRAAIGSVSGMSEHNMSQTFLLYKGGQMAETWIEEWEQFENEPVRMPGFSTCTKSLQIALDHAFTDINRMLVPTLFVISCKNCHGFWGFNMNNEFYSAYPGEKETLLSEGFPVYILKVEHDIPIMNLNNSCK